MTLQTEMPPIQLTKELVREHVTKEQAGRTGGGDALPEGRGRYMNCGDGMCLAGIEARQFNGAGCAASSKKGRTGHKETWQGRGGHERGNRWGGERHRPLAAPPQRPPVLTSQCSEVRAAAGTATRGRQRQGAAKQVKRSPLYASWPLRLADLGGGESRQDVGEQSAKQGIMS